MQAECRVAMPYVGREDRIVLMVVQDHNFWNLAFRPEGMNFQISEVATHNDMFVSSKILIPQNNDFVLNKRRLETIECFLQQRYF